jgi:hypothetical protein
VRKRRKERREWRRVGKVHQIIQIMTNNSYLIILPDAKVHIIYNILFFAF